MAGSQPEVFVVPPFSDPILLARLEAIRQLAGGSSDRVAVMDRDFNVVYANEAAWAAEPKALRPAGRPNAMMPSPTKRILAAPVPPLKYLRPPCSSRRLQQLSGEFRLRHAAILSPSRVRWTGGCDAGLVQAQAGLCRVYAGDFSCGFPRTGAGPTRRSHRSERRHAGTV